MMNGVPRLDLLEPEADLPEPRLALVIPQQHPQMRRHWIIYKRGIDVALSLIIIAVVLALLVAIGIAIKCDSRGPILFRQKRRGLNGTLFSCLKFRTMHVRFCDPEAKVQSIRKDPRRTRIGRFLRSTSLDELPQIFNVLIGNMSLIGPRPHAPGTNINGHVLPDIMPEYLARYRVRPGITGWAQVHGWRGILDTEDKLYHRVEHDLYYIANWSPLLDLRILLKTVKCLFSDHDDNAF